MSALSFVVPGILPGWQRAGKNGKRHFTPEMTAAAEREIAAHGRQAASGVLLEGALCLVCHVYLPVPASWSEKRRKAALAGEAWPAGRPDWDNLGKLVSDALNRVCYKDDAQISDGRVIKWYALNPSLRVELWERHLSDVGRVLHIT